MSNRTGRVIDLLDKKESHSFENIYEQYADRVLNLVFRLTGDEETARDMTQEIFVKIYRNLNRFEGKSHIYTWIYRIAVNHISNFLKRERRFKWINMMDRSITDFVHEDQVESSFQGWTSCPAPDRQLEGEERTRIVLSAIQSLPVKYRVPLVLHHYDEMSYKDIATALDLSISAVESRIHRAKKKLIKRLEPWVEHM